MNKRLYAPLAVIVAIALKNFFNIEIAETQLEVAIESLVLVVSGVYAATTDPKK